MYGDNFSIWYSTFSTLQEKGGGKRFWRGIFSLLILLVSSKAFLEGRGKAY